MARLLITVCLLFLSTSPVRSGEPVSEQQLIAWLQELDPLPKVHYSWPLPFKSISDEILFEYARLTHAVSISGEWRTEADLERAVDICRRVNLQDPAIPASLGVNYSPWHRRFGKDLPPTDVGPTHQAELDYLRERMESLRGQLASINDQHDAAVSISCVMFDSERFHTKPDDDAWNKALTAKYDAVYDVVKEIFPEVRIEWYDRGGVHPGASSTSWASADLFTLEEQGQAFSCSLYHVPEIEITRQTFRRTADRAAEFDCEEVTPWIALASGYRRQTDKFHEWSYDWNYDLIYSWQLGTEINIPWYGAAERAARFAPWHKAKIAIFYPEPFGRTPHWGQHFVAYVRGASGIKTLPEK